MNVDRTVEQYFESDWSETDDTPYYVYDLFKQELVLYEDESEESKRLYRVKWEQEHGKEMPSIAKCEREYDAKMPSIEEWEQMIREWESTCRESGVEPYDESALEKALSQLGEWKS